MSLAALKLAPCLDSRPIKVMDLGEDGHDFYLYKTFPYFVDVLEWLEGTRPLQNIRHSFSLENFRVRVLPILLARLRLERLVRKEDGRLVPSHDAVALKNMPRDPWIHCEIATSAIDKTVERCLGRRLCPTFETVRTKASPQVIADWKRRMSELFAEIDDHDDPHGVSFTLNVLGVEGE